MSRVGNKFGLVGHCIKVGHKVQFARMIPRAINDCSLFVTNALGKEQQYLTPLVPRRYMRNFWLEFNYGKGRVLSRSIEVEWADK